MEEIDVTKRHRLDRQTWQEAVSKELLRRERRDDRSYKLGLVLGLLPGVMAYLCSKLRRKSL